MDQGGTFTDVVSIDSDGRLTVQKVPTHRCDLDGLARGASVVVRGTTAATNALLERNGRPVLLLTNEGLEDVADFGEQVRPALFSLRVKRAPPLGIRVVGVPGRIAADGTILQAVDPDDVRSSVRAAIADGVVDAAIVLLHGTLAPDEERRLAQLCLAEGIIRVTCGHEVAPAASFLRRLHTSIVDASLTPLLPRAAGGWMTSDGGLAAHDSAAWRGSRAVLSGPAGGVIAAADLARRAGVSGPVVGLDMGGTSTDVCRLGPNAVVRRVDEVVVGGVTLATPAVRIETIAAGGGSCLTVRGDAYGVGPHSAGAFPGPAVMGRGGPAALTDAEAVLGRLPAFPHVGGPDANQPLDVAAARAALDALCPGRPVEQVAAGFRAVAHASAAQAIRRIVAEDAGDPSDHTLIAFGGAGPGHACGIARAVGIQTVLIPFLAGVFSAWGIGLAQPRWDRLVRVVGSIRDAFAAASEGCPGAPEDWTIDVLVGHVGAAGTIALRVAIAEVAALEEACLVVPSAVGGVRRYLVGAWEQRFHAEHQAYFGYCQAHLPTEVRAIRVVRDAHATGPEQVRVFGEERLDGVTQAWFAGRWQQVAMLSVDARTPVGAHIVGPALVCLPGATLVVEEGWHATVCAGFLRLVDKGEDDGTAFLDAAARTTVFGARLSGIAEAMGELLARTARSVSIRERRDFSCAIFDGAGQLVVNAPHVPVHLGAMGQTVRSLLSARGPELRQGQVWMTNDPYAGGSHLPDITVVQPLFDLNGNLFGFVGCRGHHVDVGGTRAGSMPPDSRHIDEEGVVIPHVCLVSDGVLYVPSLPGCREPNVVAADLQAQVAACAWGARAVGEQHATIGGDDFSRRVIGLQAAAAAAVSEVLSARTGTWTGTEVLDDGTPLTVRLEIAEGRARVFVDAPAHPGNLNAPLAVARAAVLYTLRCLVDEPVPLNEGVFQHVDIQVNSGGLFDPHWPAAVVGGNVETSQRLVDALLVALQACAAGQGTMNNLTVGTLGGAWYETVAGGMGASPVGPGASAIQVHMTNTRATDIEVLERSFPVRVEQFCVRRGSGGGGLHRGGDGVCKVWRFLAPAEVSLLAGRRTAGAPGLAGGGSGLPGVDLRDVGDGWEPAPARWAAKAGDRLQLLTPGGGGFGPATVDPHRAPLSRTGVETG